VLDRTHSNASRPRRAAPAGVRRRNLGVGLGIAASAAVIIALQLPSNAQLSAPGAMNTGHSALPCSSCHEAAPGSMRQQIQANVRYWLGLRRTPADFGASDVDSADCTSCHARAFDRHPVTRFTEPRFDQARRELAPQRCESCHKEHSGARVTVDPSYCRHCHQDMAVEQDPLDTPHVELVGAGRWTTCLGCHDFHGNHMMSTKRTLAERVPMAALDSYFRGGASPYPGQLRHVAKQERPGHEAR
jgi:ribosomal protein L37AE/L43A